MAAMSAAVVEGKVRQVERAAGWSTMATAGFSAVGMAAVSAAVVLLTAGATMQRLRAGERVLIAMIPLDVKLMDMMSPALTERGKR